MVNGLRYSNELVVRGDGNIVYENCLLALRGKSEDAGRTLLVNILVLDFDGPSGRFIGAFFPRLGADDSGTIIVGVDTGFQRIPLVGGDTKRNRLFHSFVVRADFEDVCISDEGNDVSLVDEAHYRFDAATSVSHDVGLNRVILQVRMSDKGKGSLEENAVESLGENLISFVLDDFPLEAGTEWNDKAIFA